MKIQGFRIEVLALFLLSVLSVHSAAEELKEVSFEARQYIGEPRIASMRGHQADKELALNVDLQLAGPLYWDNRIMGRTDGKQFRYVEWNFQVGVEVLDGVSIEYEHRSQHLLDTTNWGGFPNADSLGVKWRIQ